MQNPVNSSFSVILARNQLPRRDLQIADRKIWNICWSNLFRRDTPAYEWWLSERISHQFHTFTPSSAV